MPHYEGITLCKEPAKFYPFFIFRNMKKKETKREGILKYKNARSNKMLGALLKWVFCFSKWQVMLEQVIVF